MDAINSELFLSSLELIVYRQSRDFQKKFGCDYPKVLGATLDCYVGLLQSLSLDNDRIDCVKNTCRKLKQIQNSSFKGLRSKAYTQFKNLIRTFEYRDGFYCEIDADTFLYRMRVCDLRKDIARKELFHIPFSQIRNIRTQRYSAPGYPCLYLAKSIYGCWEEMHRPSIESTLVAAFKPTQDFGLVDMRIPSKERFEKFKDFYIDFLPVIIACSIPVVHADSVFKPEYIIPQFLLEWVIEMQFGYDCMGIAYTSAFKTAEFFPLDYEWENFVLPVQVLKPNREHCSVLSFLFNMSKPTCYEFEQMRGTFNHDGMWYNGPGRLKDGNPSKHDYYYSIFSLLEEELETREFDNLNHDF